MADAREGVVLQENGDVRPGTAGPADEGGVEAMGAPLRLDPLALEDLAEQVVRVVLLEVELGVGVDPVGHLDQERGAPVDLLGHAVLDSGEVHGPSVGVRIRSPCPAARCATRPVAEIDVHEVAADRPDLFEALTVAWNETDAEVNPDDPPAPSAELTSGQIGRAHV